MKLKFMPFILVLLLGLSTNNKTTTKDLCVKADGIADTFYDDGTLSVKGLKGDALLEKLATLMEAKHTNYTTYGELRYTYVDTDGDPNKEGNVLDFYSQISFEGTWDSGTTWNREHVWPQSLSKGLYKSTNNKTLGAGGDVHHIRPSFSSLNSSRGDKKFNELDETSSSVTKVKYKEIDTGNYYDTESWEPAANTKGDVARVLMYVYTHYSSEIDANAHRTNVEDTATTSKSSNLDITDVVTATSASQAWNLLVTWNSLDPVDDFERTRNEEAYKMTGVRNPYIDHPEFANMIWNNSYSGEGALLDTTLGDGSGMEIEVPVTGIILDQVSLSLDVGKTATLAATVTPTSAKADITWTSSNNAVATVENGVVTALSQGTAIVKATAAGYSAECIVIVNQPLIADKTDNKGCAKSGASILTLSLIVAVLGIVVLKKKD